MPIVSLYLPQDGGWFPKSVRLERVPTVGEFLAGSDDEEFYVVRAVVHHLDLKVSEVWASVADKNVLGDALQGSE